MPILRQLRQTVDTWVDDEFKDFEDEVSHVDSHAPTDSASERISRFMTKLTQIRNEQLPKALKELDELIEAIHQQRFKSAEEATEMLRNNIYPIISIVFDLIKARERLDGMADMIPLQVIEEIRTDDEEN